MKYYIKTCYYMPKIRKQIGHISGQEMVEMPLSALKSGPLTPDALQSVATICVFHWSADLISS
jgi:hypothetical protein